MADLSQFRRYDRIKPGILESLDPPDVPRLVMKLLQELQKTKPGSTESLLEAATTGSILVYDATTALWTPSVRPTITGAKAGNAALASLLSGLAGMGVLVDSTT